SRSSPRPHRRHRHRCRRWDGDHTRPDRARDHPGGGDGAGGDRRDQPPAGRSRDLGLPALGAPGFPRIVVPPGHEPTGGIAMTARPDTAAPAPPPGPPGLPVGAPPDHRGSWIPSGAMIATRFMELRKRRGLMIALLAVTVGIPAVFLAIRLLLHAFAPKTYGPAGGYSVYSGLVGGVLYVFGFIVAATLGVTAGSANLTEVMFRHLVVT